MLIIRQEFALSVLAFQMPSLSTDIAQFALTTWSTMEIMDVVAHLEKYSRELSVQVNVNQMNFWMLKETATPVETIKSFPMVSAFVLLDTHLITVEFASFHALMELSPSKAVVLHVLSTLSSRQRSEDVPVLMDFTRLTSEFVRELS